MLSARAIPERRILFITFSGVVPGEEYEAVHARLIREAESLRSEPFDVFIDLSLAQGKIDLAQVKMTMVELRHLGLRHAVRIVGQAYDVAATLAQIASTIPSYSHHEVATLEEADQLLEQLRGVPQGRDPE